ncbi:MarR family transcriptional regulator [Actinophytocola sp.]|jgi:DNA-binding MarR family transcriptional regulator|uniref:MarR family winged helix-turn-helix transcriptional regulator n=1 Tax=Actinophytocola sp. TaxID=1872138 RepID=UPI002D62F076|nr:MarR family transcriptional regulator [Actinophytocola sp.]HYQ63636.1 MarR family transcriptional regulator [Actinophytocola sp.]
MSRDDGPGPEVTMRLGYLLKHAQLRMNELSTRALEPYNVNGRELAVLVMLAGREPESQQQAAKRLDVDRTTMVALLDTLEGKGLVSRHPQPEDRRRNVVELTPTGQLLLEKAAAAHDEAEREFLSPLDPQTARQLRSALRALIS